jgi:thiol peroxidase
MASIRIGNATFHTCGELPAVGSSAPDISLVTTKLRDVSLANFAGMRKVLNIFPSIDTHVCATSVNKFDKYAEGVDGVAMLMVSYDLPFAHQRYFEEHKLTNVEGLSAIRHAGFGENYGVLIVDGPFAGMFARAVVVLDENNTVVHQQLVEDISEEPNYEAVLKALGVSIDDKE